MEYEKHSRIEPQKYSNNLPAALQQYREYFSDEQCSFFNSLNVQNLTQDQKVIVMVTGESKTGKSSTCNELIGFKIKMNSKSYKKKALFSTGSNQLTSFPIFYAYHEKLNPKMIAYHFIDRQKLMNNEILSDTRQVNSKTLKELEGLHTKQRQNIQAKIQEKSQSYFTVYQTRKKMKWFDEKQSQGELAGCIRILRMASQQNMQDQNYQTQISKLQRINDELNQEMKKSLLIQGPYMFLNGKGQERLNKYVLICDNIGSNDQIKLMKDENQFENSFNCYIVCFDLSSGFNADCKQKIREIYQICPFPKNVTISLNLANYLKPPFDCRGNKQIDIDDGSDSDDGEEYKGFQNIDSFLQQFLYRIPDTLLEILNEKGMWSKIRSGAEKMKNKILIGQNQIYQYFEEVKNEISLFKETLYQKGDQKDLISSIKKDQKIPDDLMKQYPFSLIKFSGKSFINGYEIDQIVQSVYDKADQIFKYKVKDNIQKSLKMLWGKKKNKKIDQIKRIITRAQGQLQSKDIDKEKLNMLIEFQIKKIYPIIQLIRDQFLKGFQQKRDIDKVTCKQLDQWIQQHSDGLQERQWYLFSQTKKAEYQNQISAFLNSNTNQTKAIYENLPQIIKQSEIIKQKIQVIRDKIQRQNDQILKQKMQNMLKDNIEDLAGRIIKYLCVRELQAHNQMITQIKQQAANESLNLNLVNLNIPDIINKISLVLFGFLGPALGVAISIGRIAMIAAFTAVEAAIFSIPLTIASVVYFPLKSYFSRDTDRSMIEKWNHYLTFFETIKNKMHRSSERKQSTSVNSLFSNIQKEKLILEQNKSEIEKIQSLIKALKQFLQNFQKECKLFEDQVLHC